MGAALNYARRYALFTLAGIAGEDDLDAPDLSISIGDPNTSNRTGPMRADTGSKSGDKLAALAASGRTDRKRLGPEVVLSEDESTNIRDKLVKEIKALESADAALAWAIRRIRVKGLLASTDASLVERAFQDRIRVLTPEVYTEGSQSKSGPGGEQPQPTVADSRPSSDGPAALSGLTNRKNPMTRVSPSEAPMICRWQSSAALATKIICGSSPCSLAPSVADNPARLTTFVMPNRGRLAAGYQTSSRFRCVACTIASFTGKVTSGRGGRRSASIRCLLR
jgi:hypothetical protein